MQDYISLTIQGLAAGCLGMIAAIIYLCIIGLFTKTGKVVFTNTFWREMIFAILVVLFVVMVSSAISVNLVGCVIGMALTLGMHYWQEKRQHANEDETYAG